MRTTIARLIAVCGLLLGALAFGTAASADNTNPNGAQHIDTQRCHLSLNTTYTICVTRDVLVNTVTTPSGNVSLVQKGTVCITTTVAATGALFFSLCDDFNGHTLVKDATTQVDSFMVTETVQFAGATCTFTEHYQSANGQIQFDRIEVSGDPSVC